MKRITTLLMTIFFFSTMIINAFATNNSTSTVVLSELNEDECIAFIVAHGVTIPTEFLDYEDLGKLVKSIITFVENDPNYHFAINYKVTLDFANDIKAAVNSYYGIEQVSSAASFSSNTYTLQDSTVIGTWQDYYTSFNCYAYALNQYTVMGTEAFYYPGEFSGMPFLITSYVSQWASNVYYDLCALGYGCVLRDLTYSEAMDLASDYNIICLRKCSETALVDFHFMVLHNGYWDHKPGNTSPLRFKYQPGAKDWTNEHSYINIMYEGDRSYTDSIHYFAFAEGHCYGDPYFTGNHYHSEKLHYIEYASICSGCGHVAYTWTTQFCSGPPCAIGISCHYEIETVSLFQ